MKTTNKKAIKISNIVCAILMVVFVVSTFVFPYWTYTTVEGVDVTAALIGAEVGEGTEVTKEVSLGEYLWFTEDHEDLFGAWKKGEVTDFDGNKFAQSEITELPFLATLLCVAGVIFCLWKNEKSWTCLFPLIAGVLMLISLLTKPIMQTGEGWIGLICTSALMIAGAVYPFAQWAIGIFKWFTVKKRHY